MIAIGTGKSGIDWQKIRAEYIGGGISQRKLAEKYGISFNTLIKKANVEKWNAQRGEAYKEITKRVQQKTADIVADNVTIAAEIKRKLLERLVRVLDEFPEDSATEVQKFGKTERKIYKLKDLTAMYKDLTGDRVQKDEQGNELLESLLTLERRATNGD